MWWVIGIVLILLIVHPFILKKYTKNTLFLNTDRLHLQYFFQIALLIPFIISMFLMFWVGHEHPPRWDSIGFNFFLDIQKLPLGILALSPILGAFIVYAHRSLQTEKQIKTAEKQLEETQKKNKVDIYFSKRKFINEQLALFKTKEDEPINQPVSLYNKAFTLKENYEDSINIEFYKKLNELIVNLDTRFSHVKMYITEKADGKEYYLSETPIKILAREISIIKKILCINDIDYSNDLQNLKYHLEMKVEEINQIVSTIAYDPNQLIAVGSINIISNEIYYFLKSVQEIIFILSMKDNIDLLLPCFNKTWSIFSPLDKNGT